MNQVRTTDGASPLYIASYKGNVAIVKVLIKAGGNVKQARTTDGTSPLCIASDRGHVAIVKVLIKADGNINQANNDGLTAFFISGSKFSTYWRR